MEFKSVKTATAVLIAVAMCATSAYADTTIKVLRSEPGNDGEKALYAKQVSAYEASHPGVHVQFEYLSTEAFKQKLPTLLQSDARPDLFYSWGGGVLADQAAAGFLKDVTKDVSEDWAARYSPTGVNAFTVNGQIVGAPINASEVVFWTNLDLAKKAGVDVAGIKTWADFLAAVKKAKDAGVTPIVVGGKDKWPLHFYYGYLALREAGAEGFKSAIANKGDGFAAPAFVKAAEDFKQLIDLKPFQPGFMDTTFEQASGMFGDGKGLFHLMGDWDYGSAKQASASGKGIEDSHMAVLRFPAVDGGAGNAADTFGGLNGWAVSSTASPEAIDFLKFVNSPESLSKGAAAGYYIPATKSADTSITNPFFKEMSQHLSAAPYHQIFLDQALGADVGATFNDVSADLAQGNVTPEEAAKTIQDAWSMR
ncbi:ABC transporter substrate-binding protein [Rhizobium sp. P28RR-XV]|uniref:ABC transporter substrate-binding protein n=1 Tax=Rhizobium sp. P28RR-XV TaxID=2726737 RepID=UPI0014570F3C|nr:ABC transporter substrate-binding protein [Rhizobium sp. P28RR-XV]NLR88390.1 carbohydrate ABC transporter substrate-binding protein [Rhizobium sp. P28RR-XV]